MPLCRAVKGHQSAGLPPTARGGLPLAARRPAEEVFKRVAPSRENEDAKGGMCQVLLELKVLVGGYKDLEPGGGRTSRRLAVSQARPAFRLYGMDLVTNELPRQLLIEQNAHEPSKPHGLLRERPPLARAIP